MKLQASAHATSSVIRRKSTPEPQPSMNPPGSVPQKQPAHPSLTTGSGGTRRPNQIITFLCQTIDGYTLNICCYWPKANCKVHYWSDGSSICSGTWALNVCTFVWVVRLQKPSMGSSAFVTARVRGGGGKETWKTRSDSTRRRSKSFVHFTQTIHTPRSITRHKGRVCTTIKTHWRTIVAGFDTNFHLMVGEISSLSATFNNRYSKAVNELENQDEWSVCAYWSGNASRSHLPGNAADLPTARKSSIWAEAAAIDKSRTRAEEHYSCTVRTQQLKINPIPASRGDLIT